MEIGEFSSNSSVYAGAQLISNGTPRLPCPYYNSTTFIDSQGYPWLVRCGFDISASDIGSPLYGGTNMTDCMRGMYENLARSFAEKYQRYCHGRGHLLTFIRL